MMRASSQLIQLKNKPLKPNQTSSINEDGVFKGSYVSEQEAFLEQGLLLGQTSRTNEEAVLKQGTTSQ